MGTEIEEDFKFKRNGDVSYDQPKDEHFLLPVESGNKQKKPHSRREGEQGNDWEVDCGRDHFPFCIVWCPLPVLTWLLPFIGHLGIVTSEGIIHDFAGPYHVNRNPQSLVFGRATKYYRVPLDQGVGEYNYDQVRAWDEAIEKSSAEYDEMMHNLICNNCHSHVARVLNRLNFKNIRYWNTLILIIFMMMYGKSVSFGRLLQTYLPFFLILLGVVFFSSVFGVLL